MLTSLRRLPWRSPQLGSVTFCHRNFSISAACRAVVENLQGAVDGQKPKGTVIQGSFGSNSAEMLETFLETVGAQFKAPQRPNNWLGGDRVGYVFDASQLGHLHGAGL